MPPKARITRELIINAGIEVIRENGVDKLNARTISEKLDCSTQPVMYYFKKIEDIKKAVYQKADEYHTAYITAIGNENPMLEIGLAYIRFAINEKHLFRFLFQSDEFSGKSICELINAQEAYPILTTLSEAVNASLEQAKTIFKDLFLFVHGYASMLANNSLTYDEEAASLDLERALIGAVYASKGGQP